MDERLRDVAAHLALCHVVLLGQQPRRPARDAVALEPAQRRRSVALLVGGQGDEEATEHERAFGVTECPVIVAETTGVAVIGEFTDIRRQRPPAVPISGGDGTAVAGSSRAPSSRLSSGSRCQRPDGSGTVFTLFLPFNGITHKAAA